MCLLLEEWPAQSSFKENTTGGSIVVSWRNEDNKKAMYNPKHWKTCSITSRV